MVSTGSGSNTSSGASDRNLWPTAIALTVLAFAIRIVWIDHPALWKDEVFSWVYTWHSYAHHVDLSRDSDIHPPLYPVMLKAWIAVFGDSRTAMRGLSVLFGALSIVPVYLIARQWTDQRIALLAALFLAVNPVHIHFSRELRNYAALSFFLIWATYFFSALLARNSRLSPRTCTALFALCLALCYYTHYIAVLFFALFGIAALALLALERNQPAFRAQCIGIVAAGLLCIPQSVHMFGYAMGGGAERNEWIPRTTLRSFYQQTLGAYPFPPLFKPIMAVIYAYGSWTLYRRSRPLFLLAMVFVVGGLLLCAFMGLFKGIYLVRSIQCFVLLSPLLLACAIARLPRVPLVLTAVAIAALNLWSARGDYPAQRINDPGPALQEAISGRWPAAVFFDTDLDFYMRALKLDISSWRGIQLDKVDEGASRVDAHLAACHASGTSCGPTAVMIAVRPPFFAEDAARWNRRADSWKRAYGARQDITADGYRLLVIK
jgi:mannosyltransferase